MNESLNNYKCIFFDLDHTLWDYECNSKETLLELFDAYQLADRGVPVFDLFHEQFQKVNLKLWDLYDRGMINSDIIRQERFKQILEYFYAYDARLCHDLSHDYLNSCPKKNNLVPYALDVLGYLSGRYQLTIVTNGFEEIQSVKLSSGKIQDFFQHVVTSQRAGAKKPSKQIFDYAMSINNVDPHEVMMIGDNLITDIGGAANAQIDAVFYNPAKISHSTKVAHEISCLSELKNIL